MKVEKTVTITTTGVLEVTVTPDPSRGYVGTTFIFTVNWTPPPPMIPPGCEVSIDFGDGTTDSRSGVGPPVTFTHKYASARTYTVRASVRDLYTGATGSDATSVEVRPVLTVAFDATPKSGPIPLEVTFSCEARGGYLNYAWTLDFGDGTPPASGTRTAEGAWTVRHTYERVGTFTAKLTVTDALGASLEAEISILGGVAPPAPLLGIAAPLLTGTLGLAASQFV